MASLDAALAENHEGGRLYCLPVESGSRARVSQNCDSGPDKPSVSAMEVEAAQLSVQRCTADAERFGGGRNVAVAARQRPLYGGPLGLVEIPRRAGRTAEQVGCRQRLLQKIPGHGATPGPGGCRQRVLQKIPFPAERQPRRTRRTDDEIIGIDRDQPTAATID